MLARIDDEDDDQDGVGWYLNNDATISKLRDDIESLRELAAELPSHLHARLHALATEVRTQYRIAIPLAWVTTAVATLLLGAAVVGVLYWLGFIKF